MPMTTPTKVPFLSCRHGTPLTHTLGAVLCANATFVNVIISPDTMPIFIVNSLRFERRWYAYYRSPLAISECEMSDFSNKNILGWCEIFIVVSDPFSLSFKSASQAVDAVLAEPAPGDPGRSGGRAISWVRMGLGAVEHGCHRTALCTASQDTADN
jgi:hypothetical protein